MDRPERRAHKVAKATSGVAATPATVHSREFYRMQDAVYREMYLLETRTPGSEMGLALALLRAVAASGQPAIGDDMGKWVKEVCPICLKMIEEALASYCTCPEATQ